MDLVVIKGICGGIYHVVLFSNANIEHYTFIGPVSGSSLFVNM